MTTTTKTNKPHKPSQLERILMERDGMTDGEAYLFVQDARERVLAGEDPEEILCEDFGLEPDYIFDLI